MSIAFSSKAVMNILVKSARKAKPEPLTHFEGMITLSKPLQKFGEKYMWKQGSPVPPLKNNWIKKLKIQVIKNVTVKQCNKQPNKEDASRNLVTSIRKMT